MGSQTATKQAKVEAAAPTSAVEPPMVAALPSSFGSNRALARLFRSAGAGALRSPRSLAITPPDDPTEREAERVAGQVMRMPAGSAGSAAAVTASSSTAAVRRKCAACEDEENRLQRAEAGPAPVAAPPVVSEVLSSPGRPLSSESRDFFEPRFGADFSGVRVHDGPAAARSATAVSAKAYTVGSDVVFAAGQYSPHTEGGKQLIAHELTHVVQAGEAGGLSRKPRDGAPPVPLTEESSLRLHRLPSLDDIADSVGGLIDDAGDALGDAADAVGEAASAVGGAISDAAGAVGEAASDAAGWVADKAEAAVDWLATQAGRVAQALVEALGGVLSITEAGLEIRVPRVCPLDAFTQSFDLPSLDAEFMVPLFGIPLGPLALVGEAGLAAHLEPRAQVQLGPVCLHDIRILINPLTNTYSISGSVSATAATALSAEARAGLRGALSLAGVVVIGGVPVPISVPLVGVEGGVAGMIQGIGAGTITIGGGLSIGGGTITMSQTRRLDLGLAADLALGAYAQLDIGGNSVCRIYWQPYEWHGDVAGSIGMGLDLTVIPGGSPGLVATLTPPTFDQIPFEQIPLAISRDGFSDDCPIIEQICDILRLLGLLPSQNGGVWNEQGPYGPGPRLPGPLQVYQKNPGIPSGAECRGACGPDCDTCEATPVHRYTDPATGEVWEYTNFQTCGSNEGCRDHDAAFDWAADVHGETGKWAIIMPWHMAANIECACNNLAGNCIAWIAGLPPYDSTMFFADTATPVKTVVPPGPAPGPGPTQIPLDEARRIVQEGSVRIAELVRQRPNADADPDGAARIDRQIEQIERERSDALIQVVMADNPAVEIVDRAKGIFRVPVTDDRGNTTFVFGSILVVWHVAEVSPSVFRLRSQIAAGTSVPGVTTRLTFSGTGAQGRVQPFPGDLDFVEEIDITAGSNLEAGQLLARTVIEFVRRNSANPDLEFLRMLILYKGQRSQLWTKADILVAARGGPVFNKLAEQLSTVDRNINTFWRTTVDGRLVDITKVLSVRATTVAGDELISLPRRAAQNAAFLDEPDEIPPGTGTGDFATAMRQDAIKFAQRRNFLKAAKRAYNYFTVIGNLEAMAELEPVFRTDEARINQQVSVVEAVASALSGERGTTSASLTRETARNQLLAVAAELEATPDAPPNLLRSAAAIRRIAGRLRADRSGFLAPDEALSEELDTQGKAVKRHIDTGVEPVVRRVFARHLPEAQPRPRPRSDE